MREELKELSELTPIEILNDFRNRYYNDGNSTENGIVANALNDIMPRMIVPPVKVGQTVYCVVEGFNYVVEGKIYEYTIRGDGMAYFRFTRNGYFTGSAMDDVIGKTVFLAREAAEEALKARENNA